MDKGVGSVGQPSAPSRPTPRTSILDHIIGTQFDEDFDMEEIAPLVAPNKRQKVQVASRFDTIFEKHLREQKNPPSVKARMNNIMTEFSNNVYNKIKVRKRKEKCE